MQTSKTGAEPERRPGPRLGRTGWFFLAAALSGLLLLVLPPLPGNGHLYLAALWLGGLLVAGGIEMARLVGGEWHLLAARLGWRSAKAPRSYVRSLFDTYAARFDQHLMVELAYAAPNHLRDLLDESTMRPPVDTLVDLGCGTGVMAPLCRPLARQLIGVDLSPRMLARADARGLYDALEEAEIVAFLERRHDAFDVLIAADVVVYLGDLGPFLAAARKALRPGGHLAFTTEMQAESGWRLMKSGRYAHAHAYVAAMAAAAGLEVERVLRRTLRTEADLPVLGGFYLLRRPGSGTRKNLRDACMETVDNA